MHNSLPAWLFFIPSVLGLQIGLFVLVADRRTVLNQLIFLTSLAVSLWNLENVWEMTTLPAAAVAWLRLGGIFLPVLSLHVLIAWRGHARRTHSALLALGYAWAVVAVLTGPQLLVVPTPEVPVLSGPILPPYIFTPGFVAYAAYVCWALALSVRLLWEEHRSARRAERAKVVLVALASGAGIGSGALGLFFHAGFPFHTLNAISTLIYLGALAWVVVRYRFGNPSLLLRTSAIYSVALALVAGVYVGAVVLLSTWLQSWQKWDPLVVAFFCVLTVGPLFYPLQNGLTTLLGRFFPLPRDLYYEGLKRFLQELNVLAPLPDLAGFIVTRLASLFELSSAALLVQPATGPPFLQTVTTEAGWPELAICPLPDGGTRDWSLGYLRRHSELPLVTVLPLVGRSRTVGALALSRHPDGSPLTAEERDVLESLSRQAGIALESAALYSELVALKNHYLTVIQSTANALLIVDPAGRVEDANQAALSLFGPATALFGKPVGAATGQATLQAYAEQAIAAKAPLSGRELAVRRPAGEPAPFAVTVSPLPDPESGESSGAVITLADLSPIRAMERQVERAERLSAMGQLTAGLSHELRNGLNKITGYATMLADELPPDDLRRRFPEGILEDAGALELMLQRFLAFAREEKLTCTAVSLPELVERVLSALQPELRTRHIALATEVDTALPPVLGDRAQLSQALTNLVLNAVEAMGREGILTLRLRSSKTDVELQVADTGPGIPADRRELVFNPFYTTKPDGTGLGLSITHRIITRHGGTVELASQPGCGTTVTLRLPLTQGGREKIS
jgi:PAS domain S-box-containing protein